MEPLKGKPTRFPPGRIAVRLEPALWQAYKALYARYQTVLEGLPVLRERDFDGRVVTMTPAQLEALNRALVRFGAEATPSAGPAFEAQERSRSQLFKRLQYLS